MYDNTADLSHNPPAAVRSLPRAFDAASLFGALSGVLDTIIGALEAGALVHAEAGDPAQIWGDAVDPRGHFDGGEYETAMNLTALAEREGRRLAGLED